MERRTVLGRLNWQFGDVLATQVETARTKSITLALPNWMGHRPGQHVDVRLTAEDGYQAERSYSIGSPPEEQPRVTLTVERLDDGEVSPYLTDELRAAYEEVIYRDELEHLVRSSTLLEVVHTLTRVQPSGWTGYRRRIDTEMLREVAWLPDQHPLAFICGPTPFVETAAASLVTLRYEPGRIKTERFGPTGEA